MSNLKNLKIAGFIIIAIAFIAFFPSLSNGFVSWDDEGYLHENKFVFDFSITGIKAIFSNIIMANYHPLTIVLYSALYGLFKLNPFPYHLVNVLLHLTNIVLVLWFIYKLSNKPIVAMITALLFAIHPLHVESVTWVSEAKDVLYTLFFMLSLIYYLKYLENYRKIRSFLYYSLVFFILSCLSKGMAVTLPLILIIIDYFYEPIAIKQSIKRKDNHQKTSKTKINSTKDEKKLGLANKIIELIPFFIVALIFGIIAIVAQKTDQGIADTSSHTILDRIVFPNYGVLFYFIKMILPINLSILYPYPQKINGVLPMIVYISPIIVLALVFLVYYSKKKTKSIIFGCLFFIISILPILQILPVGISIASDRYFYVSSIGLFFIVGVGFDQIYQNKTWRTFAIIVLGIITVLLSILTFQRTKVWKDSISLWTSVMKVNPLIDKAYYGVGNQYYRENKIEEAIPLFKKTLEVNPQNVKALNNLGNCYYHKQQYDTAFAYFSRLIEVDPKYTNAYHNLGNVYYMRGEVDKALENYNKVIALDPNFGSSYFTIGLCYQMKKDQTKAMEFFKKAADLGQPDAVKLLNKNK